jgi:hypothetical protein
MATCNDCYGTNTAQPCASVGCLSTNYGKCITYSGSNLFCQKGSIATFTFTGVAVAPTLNTTVTASATGGNGTGATFTVVRKAGETTYTVTLDNPGSAYEVSDTLTIAGTLLGGASPANDITISVTTLAAVIANGDDLDKVIANINNRLCLVSASSPSGLDYTAFNYQCLRVGGNLEGVGTVITTAQGFTEAVASALCSLNTRLKGVELPPIIVDSYFSGSLISGTSTLTQVLNEYGEAVGDLNDKFTVTTSSTCGTFVNLTTLTAKPSPTASLGTWFDWVSTNVCTNFTTLDSKITEQTTEHTTLNNFLYGVNQAYPNSGTRGDNFVDTACLPGGSATSNVRAAVDLIASELCSLKSIVTAGPTSNYTVNWNCFDGTYPSNSVFAVASPSVGTFVGTTTLQTHLDQIAKALSALNIQFSSEFTVVDGDCGPVISLASGSSFTCSALASCNLNALGDVTYNTLGQNQILIRDSSNTTWFNVGQTVKITIPNGGSLGSSNQFKDFSYDGVTGKFTSTVALPITDSGNLTQSATLPAAFSLTHATLYSQLPILRVNKSSGIIQSTTAPGFLLQNISGSPFILANNNTINILSYSNTQFKAPLEIHMPVIAIEKTAAMAFSAARYLALRIDSNGASNELIGLTNISGTDITIPAGFYLEVYFGGASWPMVI